MNLAERFAKILNQDLNLKGNERILIALSGGLDSMVLFHLLRKASFDIGIIHVNYNLRGKDSISDKDFVESIGKEFSIPSYVKEIESDFDWKVSGSSVQMQARDIRYDFFEEVLARENYDFIATAHQLNDSYETALLNWIKGNSLRGLAGIPRKNAGVIRPLLSFEREEIFEYAKRNKIHWREDKSNAENKYQRNLLRNKIIPLLKEINPGILASFLHRSNGIRELNEYFERKIESSKNDWILDKEGGQYFDIKRIEKDFDKKLILKYILETHHFNSRQIEDSLNLIDSEIGKYVENDGYRIVKDRKFLILHEKIRNSESEISIDVIPKLIEINGIKIHFESTDLPINFKDEFTQYVSLDSIKWPMSIRKWQEGDRFRPLGMKGSKKLSDFLIDKKIPLHDKEKVLVLLCGGEILCIPGFAISEDFKLENSDKKALKITMMK